MDVRRVEMLEFRRLFRSGAEIIIRRSLQTEGEHCCNSAFVGIALISGCMIVFHFMKTEFDSKAIMSSTSYMSDKPGSAGASAPPRLAYKRSRLMYQGSTAESSKGVYAHHPLKPGPSQQGSK